MDKLPAELIYSIFDLLSIKCLINCRETCIKFKKIVDQMNLINLFIDFDKEINKFKLLKCISPKFDSTFHQSLSNTTYVVLPSIKFELTNLNLFKLKQLFLKSSNLFQIINLNKFPNLEFMELDQLDVNLKINKFKLDLLNLKIFKIKRKSDDIKNICRLIINSPKLIKIGVNYSNLKYLKFIHKQSIEYLELFPDDPTYKFEIDVLNFSNLQYLIAPFIWNLNNGLHLGLINKFKNLKELHLFHDQLYCYNDLIFLKNQLKLDNLKIYLNCVNYQKINLNHLKHRKEFYNSEMLISINQSICSDKILTKNVLIFYLDVYNYLSNNLTQNTIEFNLLDKFNLPIDLIHKFKNVNKILINDHITNKEQFNRFLYELPNLKSLRIVFGSLDKEFYSRKLLSLCPFLKKLEVDEHYEIDFNFIIKFRNLIELKTKQIISRELIMKIFNKINYFDYFNLVCSLDCLDGKKLIVIIYSKDVNNLNDLKFQTFEIRRDKKISSNLIKKFKTIEEVLEFYN